MRHPAEHVVCGIPVQLEVFGEWLAIDFAAHLDLQHGAMVGVLANLILQVVNAPVLCMASG